MRVFLVTWDGAGSLTPTLALIAALHSRGHEVIVLAHDSQEQAITQVGGQFRRYTTAAQLDQGKPQPVFDFNVWFDAFNTAATLDFFAEIPRIKPDVLVIDSMMPTALDAARSTKIKRVVLVHAAYSAVPPSMAAIAAADLAISCSYPAFDAGTAFPSNMSFVGPLRLPPDSAPWTRKLPHLPLVVASASTGHQGSFQPRLLQRICDALSTLPVEAIVTTGRGIDPSELTAAPNVTIARNVDHTLTLPEASLFITHCGHGSVMVALHAGVPMLGLPPIADQPHNALLLENLGLGKLVSVMAPASTIADTATTLLAYTALHARSLDFASTHTFTPDPNKAVNLIEALAVPKPSLFSRLFNRQ